MLFCDELVLALLSRTLSDDSPILARRWWLWELLKRRRGRSSSPQETVGRSFRAEPEVEALGRSLLLEGTARLNSREEVEDAE